MSSAGVSGCVSQEQCQKPVGMYHAAYSVVDGTCSQPLMRDLDLEQDADQTTGTTVDDLAASVTTEVSLVGCTIGLKQHVADRMTKIPKSKLEGNLQVKDPEASAMEGMMLYTEFMQDGTTLRCQSNVQASFTLSGGNTGTPLGAAAAHALGRQ